MIALYLSLVDEGQENKFEEVYYQYKDLMYYIAYEVLRNVRDAEDAVQESFLRIVKNMSKIGEVKAKETKNFVAIITKREAIKIYSRKKKRSEAACVEFDSLKVSEDYVLNTVSLAIEKLPYKFSSLLTLKYVMGYSGKELSEITGLSENNVRQQLFQGRKMLEELLKEE
ncbi:MAG: RNA polymerase sigma factor [Eubacterium sp.]|nr:RNA polymerase sigma factor [Eubacterium sp.]